MVILILILAILKVPKEIQVEKAEQDSFTSENKVLTPDSLESDFFSSSEPARVQESEPYTKEERKLIRELYTDCQIAGYCGN